MRLNRLLYFLYYLKKMDVKQYLKFRGYLLSHKQLSKIPITFDVIHSVLRYNISILEYFQFRFFEINGSEKKEWAGTGTMYEYQKKMNPASSRKVLEHKPTFYKTYGEFIHHRFLSVEEIQQSPESADELLQNSKKVVLKHSEGQCGKGIEILDSNDLNAESLLRRLKKNGNDMVEEFVYQHSELDRMSPSGLNTVRIITQLDENDKVHILGARLRITVNSAVDNMAAGNIAAPIDIKTGKLCGPGVYSDITKSDEYHHPVTGTEIEGFQVPMWEKTLSMIERAALKDTRNRSIGWDVAITDKGPELIEGNHDWCKLVWQLPVKMGLKRELDRFL